MTKSLAVPIAESFYSVKYGSSNIMSNNQPLNVNIHFFYKIFSLGQNQISSQNANNADCLNKYPETHKTKHII